MKSNGIKFFLISFLSLFLFFSCKEPETEVVLNAPVITSINAISGSQVSLSWTSVSNAEYYVVKWFTNNNGLLLSDFTEEKKTTLTSTTVNSLSPNTNYVFYVYAYASNGKSKSESNGKSVKTKAQ